MEVPIISRSVIALIAVCGLAATASAQRNTKKEGPEFTKQGLLIVNFSLGPGADMRLGHRAADAVRGRVAKLVNRREVDVIDGGDIELRMERAGFPADTALDLYMIRGLARYLRADEVLMARVSNAPGSVRLSGRLVTLRDDKLRQPLPDAVAPKLDSAASMFARSIAAARAQLVPQRRCENALRDGKGATALAVAREGVAAYAPSTIARICVIWALRQTGASSAEVLQVAKEVLARDSTSPHALELAAVALDSLHRRDDAADMWLRFAATDTGNMDVAVRVAYAMFDGGNSRRAEPYVTAVSDAHPDELRLLHQKWRIAFENKSWAHAIEAGEALLKRDPTAGLDSTFVLHLGTAYHSAGQPYRAIETIAHGVSAFPKDERLYTLYTEYVRAESDSVIPRGLTLFPRSAVLLALNAKDLRSHGKTQESLEATKAALAVDSTISQGQLTVAQLQIELGRPDSALVALHRAVAGGEDTALVAQFALAKGNSLYRAANGTKTSTDFLLALRFLEFADTLHSTEQSRFLSGATALGVAQAALLEASKAPDKTEGCRLAKLGSDMIPMAKTGLEAGMASFAEAAKQSLDFLGQLEPYATQQTTGLCAPGEVKPPG